MASGGWTAQELRLAGQGERRGPSGTLGSASPAPPRSAMRKTPVTTASPSFLTEAAGCTRGHRPAAGAVPVGASAGGGWHGESAGVARQYCGALGKIANCQAGVFLAHVGPRGRALVDKRLYLPEEWTGDGERCATAGVPANRREYQSKTELALDMLECAQARGHLSAQWVAGDSAFGMSPTLREGLASAGMYYVLDVRPDMTVWPLEPTWTDPPYQGNGRPRKPRPRREERRTMSERSTALPPDAWRELTIAAGSQGPRTYLFSAQRVRVTRRRKPGEILWAIYRQNRDGSEPRYYLSNAPEDTPLETLAYVGGSRWRIETEFETEKSDVGLDEYETRTWPGWHHHITMCLLAGAFLLTLQQDWGGKDAPDHPAPGVPSGA